MTFDAAIRRSAQSVLHTFGTNVTLRNVTLGAYAPSTGTSTPSNADQVVKGRFEEYLDSEFGDIVQVGDRKLTIAAADLTWTPSPTDLVLVGTQVFAIVTVLSEYIQDLPGLYVLQIRG